MTSYQVFIVTVPKSCINSDKLPDTRRKKWYTSVCIWCLFNGDPVQISPMRKLEWLHYMWWKKTT